MSRGKAVYSEDERKAALELAAATTIKGAAEHLGIARNQIYRWIEKYPQFWSDLRAGDTKDGRRKFAERLEVLADRYTGVEHDLLDKIEDGTIQAKDAKEAAALLKAMGSSRQTATVGAKTLSGESDLVEHTINFPALEQAMERLLATAAPAALTVANEAEAEHVD